MLQCVAVTSKIAEPTEELETVPQDNEKTFRTQKIQKSNTLRLFTASEKWFRNILKSCFYDDWKLKYLSVCKIRLLINCNV